MNAGNVLQAGGSPLPSRRHWWTAWLPTRSQMQQGIQAQFDLPLLAPPTHAPAAGDSVWAITMRQGLGLVVAAALVAGLIPFAIQWVTAARLGTVAPFAELAHNAAARMSAAEGRFFGPWTTFLQTGQTLAGMQPAFFPGWLAALLSALGLWINWPLRWLSWWIAYGLGVLAVAKLLGAPATLQRFYALTAYASLPLVLTGLLGWIPCLGPVVQVIAVIWALVVYVAATRAVTGVSAGRALICVVLPGGLAALVWLAALAALAVTVLRFWL
jgi:hypothetical protein